MDLPLESNLMAFSDRWFEIQISLLKGIPIHKSYVLNYQDESPNPFWTSVPGILVQMATPLYDFWPNT